MQEKQVTVMVRLKAKKGMGARLRAAALSLIPKTRQESGCIDYFFHVDEKDPESFMFYENWTDNEALQQHLDMPYLKDFQRLLDEILAEEEDFTLWRIVG